MVRLVNFFPTLLGVIAFILSVICLFAGKDKDFETGCDVLTLFTPKIGSRPGMPDFYSIFASSYCEGTLGSNGQERNITGCFNHTVPFSFDPIQALQRGRSVRTSLASLGWPDAITGDFRAFALTNYTMTVLYTIGVAVAGAGIAVRLGLEIHGRYRPYMAEGMLFLIAFTSLGIAAIIASVMSFEFVGLVNYHGRESGVTAVYGEKFLAMSWSGVALLLGGSLLSAGLEMGRGKDRAGQTGKSDEEA